MGTNKTVVGGHLDFGGRKRAAKKGLAARQKATCVACGKGIWNRLICRTNPKTGQSENAHSGCISGAQEGWERCW